jgi:ferredoxin
MSYKITEDCISCGACEPDCPNQAITEGDTVYEIAASRCTECVGSYESSRCVDLCPVDSCVIDTEEAKDALLERWKTLHPGEEPAAGTF